MIYREFENRTIEGSADCEKAVYDLLEKLWGTRSGWAVIRAVVDTRKKVKKVATFCPAKLDILCGTDGRGALTAGRFPQLLAPRGLVYGHLGIRRRLVRARRLLSGHPRRILPGFLHVS